MRIAKEAQQFDYRVQLLFRSGIIPGAPNEAAEKKIPDECGERKKEDTLDREQDYFLLEPREYEYVSLQLTIV
jgi:hypothetical protein